MDGREKSVRAKERLDFALNAGRVGIQLLRSPKLHVCIVQLAIPLVSVSQQKMRATITGIGSRSALQNGNGGGIVVAIDPDPAGAQLADMAMSLHHAPTNACQNQ